MNIILKFASMVMTTQRKNNNGTGGRKKNIHTSETIKTFVYKNYNTVKDYKIYDANAR